MESLACIRKFRIAIINELERKFFLLSTNLGLPRLVHLQISWACIRQCMIIKIGALAENMCLYHKMWDWITMIGALAEKLFVYPPP